MELMLTLCRNALLVADFISGPAHQEHSKLFVSFLGLIYWPSSRAPLVSPHGVISNWSGHRNLFLTNFTEDQ